MFGAIATVGAQVVNTVIATATTTATKLSEVVTPEMLGGVLDEVTALLPVTIPVAIGFIGLRKGISFVMGVLHAA